MTCLDRLPALVSTLLLICSVESSSDHVVVSRNVIEEASSYSTLTKESRIIGGWEVSLCTASYHHLVDDLLSCQQMHALSSITSIFFVLYSQNHISSSSCIPHVET